MRGMTRLEFAVAVLAIGLALLVALPVLADSNSHALQVACVNNMKNIGAGFLAYAGDYGGMLPDWGCPALASPGALSSCWHAHLYEVAYVAEARAFVCPAEPDAVAALEQGGIWGVRQSRADLGLEAPNVCTYQAHHGMTSWSQENTLGDDSIKDYHSPVGRLSDNRLSLLWDGMQCFTFDGAAAQLAWQWRDPPVPNSNCASARHEGSLEWSGGSVWVGTFNVLWLDGHVTNIAEDRIIDETRLVRRFGY